MGLISFRMLGLYRPMRRCIRGISAKRPGSKQSEPVNSYNVFIDTIRYVSYCKFNGPMPEINYSVGL